MRRWAVALALVLAACDAPSGPTGNADPYSHLVVTMLPGRVTALDLAQAMFTVNNNSDSYVESVFLDCTFYDDGGAVLDVTKTLVKAIPSGAQVAGSVYSSVRNPLPSSATCRVVSAH